MAQVFTVYNCGTGFNRENTEELIGFLGQFTMGTQAKPGNMASHNKWMITDGPGSTPKGKNPDARTPGTFGVQMARKIAGNIGGYGWGQNLEDAMDIIKWIHSKNPIGVVNMAGWSRGAVTCMMMANALRTDPATSNIYVNIFAADPVPGPGNRADPRKNTIPDNVASYYAIAAEDEKRRLFKPTNIGRITEESEALGRNIKYITIPGVHNTGVLMGTPLSKIVWLLATKFLTKRGTQLSVDLKYSHLEICELYARTRLDLATYRNMRSKAGAIPKDWFSRKLPNPFGDSLFWVNDHHRSQFLKVFPTLGTAMVDPSVTANGYPPQLAADLRKAETLAPWTYKAMVQTGIIDA